MINYISTEAQAQCAASLGGLKGKHLIFNLSWQNPILMLAFSLSLYFLYALNMLHLVEHILIMRLKLFEERKHYLSQRSFLIPAPHNMLTFNLRSDSTKITRKSPTLFLRPPFLHITRKNTILLLFSHIFPFLSNT